MMGCSIPSRWQRFVFMNTSRFQFFLVRRGTPITWSAVALDQPVAAHQVLYPALTDPAGEDVAADRAVGGEEVPVVAGDIPPTDPGRASDAHERPAHPGMGPDRLALDHVGQPPVWRILAVDAPPPDVSTRAPTPCSWGMVTGSLCGFLEELAAR
jgi:hypothetical protein